MDLADRAARFAGVEVILAKPHGQVGLRGKHVQFMSNASSSSPVELPDRLCEDVREGSFHFRRKMIVLEDRGERDARSVLYTLSWRFRVQESLELAAPDCETKPRIGF